jgi:hypothetical protein
MYSHRLLSEAALGGVLNGMSCCILLVGGKLSLADTHSIKAHFAKEKHFFHIMQKIMAGSVLPPAIWLRIT